MSTEERKNKHRQKLRKTILESAMDLISSTGYEKFTMRQLAEKIDYSPRTIYLYFKNREDLIDAITEQIFIESLNRLSATGSGEPVAGELFRSMINRHIRNGLEQPELYRAVIMNLSRNGYKASETELIFYSRINRLINSSSTEATELIISSLRSTTLMLINKLPELQEEKLEKYISIYTEIILRGIL